MHKDPDWFTQFERAIGKSVYEPRRIDLLVEEMRALIELLEARTGRRFDEDKFVALMQRINEQEGYIAEAARMIGEARPCPVSIADQMPNTMIPQWHRGSAWAVAHARRFRDEVAERVAKGVARQQQRARAADVDRRRAVARPGLLQRARRALWRGVRLVDVHAVRRPAVHPRAARAAAARAGQPRLLA